MALYRPTERILFLIELLLSEKEGLRQGELLARLQARGFRGVPELLRRDLEFLETQDFPLRLKELEGEDFLCFVDRSLPGSVLTPDLIAALHLLNDEDPAELTRKSYGERLDILTAACLGGQLLEILYQSPTDEGSPVRHWVGPECLVFADSGLFLVGRDLEDKSYKSFLMPRILEAELLARPYESSLVSPEVLFRAGGDWPGRAPVEKVSVEVHEPWVTRLTDRPWHSSQKIEVLARGSKFSWDLPQNETLVQSLLAMGDSVRILEPISLQQRVQEAAQRVALHHSKKIKKAA